MPQPLKQSLDQSKWLREAEKHLRELENLVDSNLEEEKLKPQLSMGEDVQSPGKGEPLHPNVRAPLSHVVRAATIDLPRLGNKLPAKHHLGKLSGLYQMKGCTFNPEWKVPDISDTHFDLQVLNECPSRNWKYLTPAKFWPKSISYFPVQAGVKAKYPDNVMQHESIVGKYLTRLYEAGILYKRISKHLVTFKGQPYKWEHQYLVKQHQIPDGATTRKINGRAENRRRGDPAKSISRPHDPKRGCNMVRQISNNRSSIRPCANNGGDKHSPTTRRLACWGGKASRINQSYSSRDSSAPVDARGRSESAGSLSSLSGRKAAGNHHHSTLINPSVETTARGRSTPGEQISARDTSALPESRASRACNKDSSIKEENVWYLRGNTSWPNRITGKLFLVDKNSRNTTEARLVVDFSQFSKGKNAMRFPRYWSPNLSTLRRILPVGMPRISLDLSQAFYHLPLNPASSSRLAVSDGQRVYYFRKAPMGVGLSPFLLHLFTTALGSEIARRFNVWTFTYMDDFLLCHPNARHLNSISHAVCTFLQELGIRINFDKTTPSPVTEIRFLGYQIDQKFMKIEEDRWKELRTVIKKIKVGAWYDWKCIQRFVGHLNFVLPFTKGNLEMLKPMYAAITNKVNFSFSSAYRTLLYKLTMGVCKLAIKPKSSVPLPRVATDATPTHGAISHITGGSAVFAFSKVRDIHIQELLMVCLAKLMIKPRCILTDSTFVCHKRYQTLPWHFAMLAKQLLSPMQLYFVPSKYNPADGPSRHKPPDWTALTYTPLSKAIYIPHRLCGT
uniref:Protein P n=1 Tax=Duck hepatitis B virus (strain China) TaxID=31510 RepID=DPOL_HPBDC|nr:RecName: Full=Protein P; Includes: RecName: Full=DNA-directed DNA polymerase; Includes: RecName: Full=RNA-directed DNA polymerase; Includes: RecName: Full=Ribonuclease H [Duck hepatitis B virus strain China]AAA45745.1 polymerase [Duck hepatitis B virus]